MTPEKCKGCKHYVPGVVFELCRHEQSAYRIADKVDFHTVVHMKTRGACQRDELFTPK